MSPEASSRRVVFVLSGMRSALFGQAPGDPVRVIFSGLGYIALLILPIWVLLHLDRGLDVSDTGYYHASISYLADNRMAVTQFGVIWNLLPVPDDILLRRIALFFLVVLASAWMAIEVFKLLNSRPQRTQLGSDQLLFGGVGIGGGVFYASLWLVDPSYNSMALGLSCALIALAMRIVRLKGQAPVSLAAAGVLVVLLLYARPPTAGALGVVLAVFVLAQTRPGFRLLGKLSGLAVAGMVGAVGLVWLLVEPPSVTWNRFQGGLELANVLARGVDQIARLDRFAETVLAVATDAWFVLAWAFLTPVSTCYKPLRHPGVQAALAGSLAVLLVVVIARQFSGLPDQPAAHYAFHGNTAALAGLIALSIALGRVVAAINRKRRRLEMRRLAIVLTLLLSAVAVVFLTGSQWFPRLAWVAGLPALALLVSGYGQSRWAYLAASSPVVAVLMMQQVAFWTVVSQMPYRLAGPLQAQTLQTEVRHGRSTLRTDAATHHLLSVLTEASADLARCKGDARPVLLDMTGRMPMAAYHLNARPPGRSWVLSGSPGSADLFQFIVDRLDDATLRSAWILDAPEFHLRHDPEVLVARGIDFETGHDLIAEVHAPYPNTLLRLYRPKGGGACALP